MTQSFRGAPRQIGFRPQKMSQSLGPKAVSSTQDPRASEIRQALLQLQQLKTRARALHEKASKTLAPQARQAFERERQQISSKIRALEARLLKLKGEARMALLKARGPILQSEAASLSLLRQEMAELEAIYRVHHPMQKAAQPALEELFQAIQGLLPQLKKGQLPPEPDLDAFEAFSVYLYPPEVQAFQALWALIFESAQQFQAAQKAEAELRDDGSEDGRDDGESDFEPLSFDTESQGDLEISFDFQAGKSVVRNQMGITLNQAKKSYQDYLDEGFQAVDETVASEFKNLKPLYTAVEYFLEAVTLDKSRYEAYFGLGYLYSLVKDLNHALYFLDVAYKISADPAIFEMIEKLKHSHSLTGVAS